MTDDWRRTTNAERPTTQRLTPQRLTTQRLTTQRLTTISPQCRLRQPVRLGIDLTLHVRDEERQRPRQLLAGPMEGVKPRAAAGIFPSHLPHNDLGIRIDVKPFRLEGHCIL